jgi:hypothetical protein
MDTTHRAKLNAYPCKVESPSPISITKVNVHN